MEGEIKFVGDLQRVSLKPRDKLVLRSPGPLDYNTIDRLRDELGRQFPGTQVLVLDGGLELGVIECEGKTE